jgi:hypothetical protein
LWFDEQESDDPPQDRSPWEQPGWYREAETWMSGKLEGLGIQATGSVQQFKAGVPVSCILRVATLDGQVYFKAAYQKPPGEARMSSLVAERWPEIAPRPLAIDEKRNWMLFPDFRMKKDNRAPLESYPEFARTLGAMQFESVGEMEEWKAHGCPDMGLDFLLGRNGEADALYAEAEPLLSSGKAALDSQEMSDLQTAIDSARRDCKALEKFGIPECLTHLDYRPDNWYFEAGKCRVMDWADVALTHPFMGMCGTLSFLDTHGTGEPGLSNAEAVDPALRKRMAESYLSAFESLGTPELLAEALERAYPVYALFRLYWVARELRYVESQGPHYLEMRNLLKATARTLIAAAAD